MSLSLLLLVSLAAFPETNLPGPFPPSNQCPPCYRGVPPACVPVPPPTSEVGQIVPNVIPTHVVYAPPGKGSSIAYSNGSTWGSTITIKDAQKRSMEVEAGVGMKVPDAFSAGLTLTTGNSWGNTRTDALDFAVTTSTGYRKPGEGDDMDHDLDEVWFLVAPKLRVKASPATACYPSKVTWTMDPDQQLRSYFLYLGELRGTRPIPAAVQADLTRWGVTALDLQNVLAVHPFPNGSEPNQGMDPARFEYLTTLPYRPPYSPGSPVASQPYGITKKTGSSSTLEAEVGYSTKLKATGGFNFLDIFNASVSLTGASSMTFTTSHKSTVSGETQSTLTLAQPSYGYAGPTVLRVYVDKVFKTFIFTLDWI